MAIVTYPLNNAEYTAEDAELFHVTRTSGIYARNSFQYSVSGANNIIIIGTGIGWIKNGEFAGKVIAQKESVSIDMGIADSVYTRIDAIVIQFSANSNETNIVVKKGAASTNAVAPPVVRDESVYELHLYHVLRKAGELTISPSNITDLRLDANYCGLMADSVTSVDTNAINLQISALIENLRNEIESVEDKSAFWLKNDIIPVTNGGTGASSPEQARNNLGITAENIGALSKNGGAMSGAIAMGGNKITGLGTPTDSADAVSKAYADKMLPKSGGTMTGYLNFDGSNGLSWTTSDGTIIRLRPYTPGNNFQITMQNPSKGIGEYGALDMFTNGDWQFGYPEKVRNAIGAAPAGIMELVKAFGINTDYILDVPNSNFNTLTGNSIYKGLYGNATGFPDWMSEWAFVLTLHYDGGSQFGVQFSWDMNGNTLCQRYKRNGVWNPWECHNPPMLEGVEYRTTERYKGKPVYAKAVSLNLAGAGNKFVAVDDAMTEVVSFTAYFIDGVGAYDLAFNSNITNCFVNVDSGNFFVNSADMSGTTVRAIVKYIK